MATGTRIKCVAVGNEKACITELLTTIAKGKYSEYGPPVFENCALDVTFDGKPYSVALYDTKGLEDYDALRPTHCFHDTDVFMVCFSVVIPSTLEKVRQLWIPDIMRYCPNVPFVLVGTQTELRHDSETLQELSKRNFQPITYEDGKRIASELLADKYVECSARNNDGVQMVFDETITAAIKPLLNGVEKAYHNGMKDGYVYLTNKKLVLIGPPCVGKTAFKALLFNWPAPKHHHSTPIASRPIRAIERVTDANEGKVWDVVESPQILKMIRDAIRGLDNSDDVIILPPASEEDYVSPYTIITRRTSEPMPIEQCDPAATTLAPSNYSSDVMKLLKKKKRIFKKSKQLHKATWVHILDSGGQPQFADISRAFLRGNAINVIVFKLTEKLSDKPRFMYSINGKVINAPKELQMTNLQLIEHFIRSITSSDTSTIKIGNRKINTKPFFIIIGTYYDEATKGIVYKREKMEETIADKNYQLISVLHEFRDNLIFYNDDASEVIFPVNNLCRLHRKTISCKFREHIMSHEGIGFKEPVPVRWYMFEIQMRETASLEKGIVSLQSCYKVGKKLQMSEKEVRASLVYFDSLTLCLYYESLLPNVIFTNPQYLLDMLSNIVRVSFVISLEDILPKGRSLSLDAQRSLRDDGVFEESLLDILELPFEPSLFNKDDFLLLLQHISVIAPIISPEPVQRYFMPVVLSTDTLTKRQKQVFSSSITPLIITFKSKVVLQGLFPTLIVSLLSRKEKPHFFIDSQSKNFPRQLRHAVKIYSEDLFGSVFLCDEYNSIEVYFTGHSKFCYLLRQVILQALSTSATILAYDIDTLDISARVACNRQHILPDNNDKPHPISIPVYQNNAPPLLIGCSVEDLPVEELTDEKQRCWLIESAGSLFDIDPIPITLPEGRLSVEHAPTILFAIREVNLWEVLGIHLGIKFAVIDQIRRNNHYQIEPSRKDMIMVWLQEGSISTSQKLLLALEVMGKMNIVYKLLPSTVSFKSSLPVYYTFPQGILNEEHASLILMAIRELPEWKELGIYLGLNVTTIAVNNFHQVETCRMNMIVKWLQTGTATCCELISALTALRKNSIAALINIEKMR